MADNYIGRVGLDGNAPSAPVSVQDIVNGAPVSSANPKPTTTAVTFPSSMSTTDATVRRVQNLWWETGASVSNTIVLGDHERVSSLLLPASGWATTATRIYIDISDDGTTWYPAQDLAGNLIFAQVGASAATKGITLSDEERARISRRMLRFKSTTDAGVAVTQAAAVACRLGSVGAETADPYSTFSFRVASGGSGTFEITGAGRVVWTVNGATTTTTIGNTLTLSTLSAPVDISVSAAFDFKDSYLNFHDGNGISFKLTHLPAKLGKLRLYDLGSSVITGSLADVPRSNTYLQLYNLGSSVITGSLADVPRSNTALQLYALGSSVITGSLADVPRSNTYLFLAALVSSVITGSLADVPRSNTYLNLYDLGSSVITGSLADVPRSNTYLFLANLVSSVITGSLADVPRSNTYLFLAALGSSVITGSLADVPRSNTALQLYNLGSSVITGDLSTNLPTLNTYRLWIYDVGGTIAGAAPQSVFGVGCKSVRLYNQSFTANDTDNTIINLAAAVTALSITGGTAVFETNRTSASDAALATLVAAGLTVTFA